VSLATTVHTSGVNWQSVAAIVGAVVVAMSAVFGLIARVVSNQITGAINKFRIEVVDKLDRRLTRIEAQGERRRPR
jgi:hypothetical protein